MDYWRGIMDWPIDTGWKCETCGGSADIGCNILEWGLRHGECRCTRCHTMYEMRDYTQDNSPRVTTPISGVKPEYKPQLVKGWELFHTPFDEWTEEQWQQIEKECNVPA